MQQRSAIRVILFMICCGSSMMGCGVDADRYDRSRMSPALEERTGYGLGPGAEPGETSIPPDVDLEDGVSWEEAVAIALWNNAAFQEAISELGLRRADLVEAGLYANPKFFLLFPLGPKQLEALLTLPLEALWLRPGRVALAELECERISELLVEGGLDLVRDVQTAYSELELQRRLVSLGEDTVQVRNRLAEFFSAQLGVGEISELEANNARIQAMVAAEELVRQRHEVRVAEERLRSLLGLALTELDLDFEEADRAPPAIEAEPESLLKEALAMRPELRAAELAMEMAGEQAGLADWQMLRMSALLDVNSAGTEGWEFGPGLEIDLPLFNQGQGRRARAEAELERAARHYVTVRHRIAREVTDAWTRYEQSRQSVEQWRTEILPAMQAARDRIRSSYEIGQSSLLPVLQSDDELGAARVIEARAAVGLLRAVAELERSTGRRLSPEEGGGS